MYRILIYILFVCSVISKADTLSYFNSFGIFKNAASVSTSRDEYIYVSDIQTNMVYKFDKTGRQLISIGGTGSGDNEFNQPVSLDASNGLDVFICDYQNNRIQRYDVKLHLISSFDFNIYNLTADNSNKIYYPKSISFLNTSDIFLIADANSSKAIKLKSLEEVSLLFANNNLTPDKLSRPVKIIRGSKLDILILDTEKDEIKNFDNYGTYIRTILNKEQSPIISIAFYADNLYILYNKSIIIYDLKKGQYIDLVDYYLVSKAKPIDISVLNKNAILILSPEKVYMYNLN